MKHGLFLDLLRNKFSVIGMIGILLLTACASNQNMPISSQSGSVDCESTWNNEKIDGAKDLEFSLKLEKSSVNLKEPKIPTLVLKNTGLVPLWVNHRMIVNRPSLENAGEVYFVIISPWGETADLITREDFIDTITAEDFVLLNPQQTIESRSDGMMSYGFLSSWQPEINAVDPYGKYCMWAVYHNQADPGLDGVVWKGKIKSNFVEFEITK